MFSPDSIPVADEARRRGFVKPNSTTLVLVAIVAVIAFSITNLPKPAKPHYLRFVSPPLPNGTRYTFSYTDWLRLAPNNTGPVAFLCDGRSKEPLLLAMTRTLGHQSHTDREEIVALHHPIPPYRPAGRDWCP